MTAPAMRRERALIVLTPVVALATVALGLHVGASSRVRGARVYAAAPGAGRPGLSLQLVTLAEEGGVPELLSMPDVSVAADVTRDGAGGERARWQGGSNSEGVAEAWLDLGAVRPGDRVRVSVTAADGASLAAGVLEVPTGQPPPASDAAVRATRTTGDLLLDVFVYGGKLVPGSPEAVLVRVRDAATRRGAPDVTFTVEAEPGLTIERPPAPSSSSGWSEARVTADFLVAGWTVSATEGSPAAHAGTWYGALPVSPGAATVDLPESIDAGAPRTVRFVVPPASRRLYVEVDDDVGRDFGAALDVTRTEHGGEASTDLPPLLPGLYWLVTSGSARGAEGMTGSTVARPFRVGPGMAEVGEPPLASLARRSPPNVSRPMVLDGLAAPRRGRTGRGGGGCSSRSGRSSSRWCSRRSSSCGRPGAPGRTCGRWKGPSARRAGTRGARLPRERARARGPP